jgi:hypothetical protein
MKGAESGMGNERVKDEIIENLGSGKNWECV